MSGKVLKILAAVGIGCAMIYFGGRVLNVRLELFWGLSTYSLAWIVVLFILPFVTGIIIGWMYGPGGKIVAHFPPLIVHGLNYIQTMQMSGPPHGASLMPLGWWGLYVLLTMEFCAFGAFAGEFMLQRAIVSRRNEDAEAGDG